MKTILQPFSCFPGAQISSYSAFINKEGHSVEELELGGRKKKFKPNNHTTYKAFHHRRRRRKEYFATHSKRRPKFKMNFSTSSVLRSAEKHLLEFPLKQLLFPVRLLGALFHFTRISFWKTKTKPNYCLTSRWTVLSQTMLMKAKQKLILISFPQTSQGKVIVQIKDHKKHQTRELLFVEAKHFV